MPAPVTPWAATPGGGKVEEYQRDALERIRACEVFLALLAGLFAWLLVALVHKGVISWDDLALGHAANG